MVYFCNYKVEIRQVEVRIVLKSSPLILDDIHKATSDSAVHCRMMVQSSNSCLCWLKGPPLQHAFAKFTCFHNTILLQLWPVVHMLIPYCVSCKPKSFHRASQKVQTADHHLFTNTACYLQITFRLIYSDSALG